MSARVFVDTNVLVYRMDSTDPSRQQRADEWLRALWHRRLGRTSFQVLAEFYVSVTRKLSPGLSPETARKAIRALLHWQPAVIDGAIFESAWAVADRYGFSWWDALIRPMSMPRVWRSMPANASSSTISRAAVGAADW